MLVVAHDEQRLEAGEALVAGDDVGGNLLVGRAEVRLAVHVVDRRREVEPSGHIRAIVLDAGGSVPLVLVVMHRWYADRPTVTHVHHAERAERAEKVNQ
jgi:hypothetical protein